jgi:porphobilinogen synthase
MEKIFFPVTQRRLRADQHVRELTAPVKLSHKSFIQPLFAEEAIREPREVEGLRGVKVDTIESVLKNIEICIENGINKFLVFPVPAQKKERDFDFSFAAGLIGHIRQNFGDDVWLATDVCLCSYTTHGHCGILDIDGGRLLNSQTVDVLSQYSAILANAGTNCVAPSDMTDGRIGGIRSILDSLGYENVSILSYAAKFSSQWYGPFRDACHSAPNSERLKNRKTYQLSPFNIRDAIASCIRDEKEGADILIVKPAGLYTDVISKLREITLKPIAAYHVSGEYAAIESLAEKGLLHREAAHLEVWAAVQRSGADIIISYAAKQAKEWIEQMDY